MPFGLCHATATFQRRMAHALTSVTKKYGNLVLCYVDDTYFRGPHRATRRGVRLHEKSGTKMQAIEVRDTQGLD